MNARIVAPLALVGMPTSAQPYRSAIDWQPGGSGITPPETLPNPCRPFVEARQSDTPAEHAEGGAVREAKPPGGSTSAERRTQGGWVHRHLAGHRLAAWLLGMAMTAAIPAAAADDWHAVQPGTAVLFRHALAPGSGDPPGFQLEDCRTQRNLNAEGRAQARRIGQAFKARDIEVGAVWSSQWCRTRETADIAFPQRRVDQPAFNFFFGQPDAAAGQSSAAQALLAGWRGPGVLVVTTHQVNITALTGLVPASGEGIIVRSTAQGVTVLGRVMP